MKNFFALALFPTMQATTRITLKDLLGFRMQRFRLVIQMRESRQNLSRLTVVRYAMADGKSWNSLIYRQFQTDNSKQNLQNYLFYFNLLLWILFYKFMESWDQSSNFRFPSIGLWHLKQVDPSSWPGSCAHIRCFCYDGVGTCSCMICTDFARLWTKSFGLPLIRSVMRFEDYCGSRCFSDSLILPSTGILPFFSQADRLPPSCFCCVLKLMV